MLRRLDDKALLPRGADVARRSIPQEEIAQLLAFAAQADTSGVANNYLRKFREEFRAPTSQGVTLNASLLTQYRRTTGRILAGVGADTVWEPGQHIKDVSDGAARPRGQFMVGYLAGAAAIEGSGLAEAQLLLSGPYVGLWAGRKEIGYATSHGGGLVLNQHRFDAVGVFGARPLKLPVLGAIRFEMQLAKIDNVLNLNGTQEPTRPFFWSARGSLEPMARLRIGVNRGMIFGGKGNYPVTASRVLKNLLGVYTSEHENAFANQLIGVDFRYRAPGGPLPSTWYLSWGADDAAGGWWHTPGIVGGIELAPFGKADAIIGVERTEFARNTRSNSIWYQNAWLRGGWADAGEVLGHPLGGHGREWRAFAEGGSPAQGWSGELAGYTRWRGSQNLYAPERAGKSVGGFVRGDIRMGGAARIELQGEIEHGTSSQSWTMTSGRAGIRYSF